MITIDRVQGMNMPGLCYLDVVDVLDVESMPFPEGNSITTEVVLKPGKQWYRVRLTTPGCLLKESWTLVDGSPAADLSITGGVGKDELAKLTALWTLPVTRFLVLATGLNGDVILAGTITEGCKALVAERNRGNEAMPVNGYLIEFRVKRSEPAPFYLPEVPVPADTLVCPSLGQLLLQSSFATVLGALSPDMYADFQDYFGGAGGTGGGEDCPTFEELLAAASNEALLAGLSTDQLTFLLETYIDTVDGGQADSVYANDVDGGDEDTPGVDGDFEADDFEPDDFITE